MFRKTALSILVLSLVSTSGAWAHDKARAKAAPVPDDQQSDELSPEILMEGVVKVVVRQAGVFSPEISGGHGSGFIVSFDKKTGRGVIFTNRHVIDGNELVAQDIKLEFNTDHRRPEVIAGKVVFISKVNDFAVIEFDGNLLQRASVRVLAMPHPQSPFADFEKHNRKLRGQPVLSIGHPLDGSNISTYGEITGLAIHQDGAYIQTQTPSNPGNSGGPLISRLTGEVIGITSAGRPSADGVNFSIPINVVLEEYAFWLKQKAKSSSPTVEDSRYIGFVVKQVPEATSKALDVYDKVAAHIPGYWQNHDRVLMISNEFKGGPLKKDDILLTMNRQVLGGHTYELLKYVQRSPLLATFEVLRQGKVQKVKVPIQNLAFDDLRRSVDFVYISGMLLQQMANGARQLMRPGLESAVLVAGLIQSADTQFSQASFPPAYSVVTAVKFGDREYPVRNLFDLKKALNENRGQKMVQVRAFRSSWVYVDEGHSAPARSNSTGLTLLDGVEDVFMIPMREVITPMQFSLHQFIEQFSFAPDAAETRDWRAFIHADRLPTSCASLLEAGGAGSGSLLPQPIAPVTE